MFALKKPSQPAPAPTSVPESSPAPKVAVEMSYGVLRSEFDQNRALAQPFVDVDDVAGEIITAHSKGQLDPRTTYQALALLRLVDDAGAEWTLGATTRRWYRRPTGGVWRVAVPPSVADASVADSCAVAMRGVEELLEVDSSTVQVAAAPQAVAPVEVADDAVESDDLLAAFMSTNAPAKAFAAKDDADEEPGEFGV